MWLTGSRRERGHQHGDINSSASVGLTGIVGAQEWFCICQRRYSSNLSFLIDVAVKSASRQESEWWGQDWMTTVVQVMLSMSDWAVS